MELLEIKLFDHLNVCKTILLSAKKWAKVCLKCLWQNMFRGCPCGVMVKAMDFGIVVSKFELQSLYYVQFRTNTLGKGMNPFILLAMG